MNWIFSDHATNQIIERCIPFTILLEALKLPDEIVDDPNNPQIRKVYHKIYENKLIRVITEDNLIVTVYSTSKINKYYKRGTPQLSQFNNITFSLNHAGRLFTK